MLRTNDSLRAALEKMYFSGLSHTAQLRLYLEQTAARDLYRRTNG